MTMRFFAFVALLGILATQCNGCPQDCLCFIDGYVSCSRLKVFPTSLPNDTKVLKIMDSDIDVFPGNVLKNYGSLSSVDIFFSTFGKIEQRAFAGLTDVAQISFYMSNISEIESLAFSEMRNISSFTMYQVDIDIIRGNAFRNLNEIAHFEISYTNVSVVESKAFTKFNDITTFQIFSSKFTEIQRGSFVNFTRIGSFSFFKNIVDTFECQSVDRLLQNAETIAFNSNKMICNCGIAWIISDSKLKNFLYSNECENTKDGTTVDLVFLTTTNLNCAGSEDVNCSFNDILPKVTSTQSTFNPVITDGSSTKSSTAPPVTSSDSKITSASTLNHITNSEQSTTMDKGHDHVTISQHLTTGTEGTRKHPPSSSTKMSQSKESPAPQNVVTTEAPKTHKDNTRSASNSRGCGYVTVLLQLTLVVSAIYFL